MAQEPYTCFIPYDQGYSGAAVTGERRIRLPVFNNALAARTQVISEFRVSSHHIVGLMFGKKRQTLYALGAKHEGGVISLLEVRVPTTDSPGQFTILELAKLDKLRHGGQFVAKLEEYVPEDALEGVLDTHVVVASLSGVASRPVYTIIMKL